MRRMTQPIFFAFFKAKHMGVEHIIDAIFFYWSNQTKCPAITKIKAAVPEHRMYVFRKTWITAMVDRSGLTLAQIAYLAGNTPAVIMKSYYGRRDTLPDAATISAALRGDDVTKVS